VFFLQGYEQRRADIAPGGPQPTFGLRPASEGAVPMPGGHFNYALAPGAAVHDALEVVNFTPQPLLLQVYGADLINLAGGGVAPAQQNAPERGVGAWTEVQPSVSVPARGVATVPFIYAASGNCHVYVDASANIADARRIVLNAKLQRPGVCNALETLLVHREIAAAFLPSVLGSLHEAGVRLHGDEPARAAAGQVPVEIATEEDWDQEYLALELAVGVVDGVEEAITHVNAHGSGHSEAIVTRDTDAARGFALGVDAACVYVNASTRFTDGGEFGMGAEIGNSTQKLHARGPIGLRELCTFKYLVEGAGHIRS